MLLAVEMIIVRILRVEFLVAGFAVEFATFRSSGKLALTLCDFTIEDLCSDWRQVCYLSLCIVAVEVALGEMLALQCGTLELQLASDAGEAVVGGRGHVVQY